jgi:beta-lactamase class A
MKVTDAIFGIILDVFLFLRKQKRFLLQVVLFICAGMWMGWILHEKAQPNVLSTDFPRSLRLSGYRFISPLLLCDSHLGQNSKSLDSVQKEINRYLKTNSYNENSTLISVYFRNLNTGEDFGINSDEKYFPASIKKLPLMIQYYKELESNPNLFAERGTFIIDKDMNSQITYPPKEALVSGNKYSIKQLIEYMIKYSDNNSFGVLYPYLGAKKADMIYENMKLYFPDTYTSLEDYITTYQVSLFFRMLFNGTYLNYGNSEDALNLLTQSDFNDGLVKKLPSDVLVAHKFGIQADKRADGKLYGELHDCGIVYKTNNPYLLCIMTKSQTIDIVTLENAIADISLTIYHKNN